ncbi:uncharacterized protein HaLaN_03157 [Haematococcus lacustris]|uniref:Uncharacterized protein n=2 Tax=Haematococcus lacustris TaxID=44745 RepID=A0A699YMU5_HAELA|nr:uncharacterized protein HaLaN_03157 [Haematococcus lacustris]
MAGERDGWGSRSRSRTRFFLIKITEMATGQVKLETRIPSDFLSGLAALVPAVSGLNLEAVLERAMRERIGGDTATPLASFPTGSGDLIQVFLVA